MRLGGMSPGDIVLADIKGRRFDAIDRRVTYRRVKAGGLLGAWRKSR